MSFCIAVEAELVISTCPLRAGACLWQHRKTEQCKYTSEEQTVEEYCARVGAELPTDAERTEISASIREAVTSR